MSFSKCKNNTLTQNALSQKEIGSQLIIEHVYLKTKKMLRPPLIQDQVVFLVQSKRGEGFNWRFSRGKPSEVNFVRQAKTQVSGQDCTHVYASVRKCMQVCLCCVYWKCVCVLKVSTLPILSSGKPRPWEFFAGACMT